MVKQSIYYLVIITTLFSAGCSDKAEQTEISFETPQKVTITGYTGHIMEPFLSRDGSILFFNNRNFPTANTNLHWATKTNTLTFTYKGEIKNINTEHLEGVPTMDNNGILYFVSTRSYNQTFSTIYKASFSNGNATDISLVEGISKNLAGAVNFDVEVTASGNHLYFVDGTYDQHGGPYTADIVIAKKNGNVFERLAESNELLKNINTTDLEYAAAISSDELELYFTRVTAPISVSSIPKIYVAARSAVNKPFRKPKLVATATGFVEAATVTPDGMLIYFHKLENDKYVLYAVNKKPE